MPIFVAALIGGLIQAAVSMVGRVLIALGVGVVAYSGLTVLLSTLKAQVVSNLSSATAIMPYLSALKVDVAVSIIFSAVAARLVINGLTSGTLKRFVLK